jgi:hypothetical protein
MNDLIFFGKGCVGIIPLNSAHMAVKGNRRDVIYVASTEELLNFIRVAILHNLAESTFAQSDCFIVAQNIQMIEAQIKIFIRAIMVWSIRKIADASLSI